MWLRSWTGRGGLATAHAGRVEPRRAWGRCPAAWQHRAEARLGAKLALAILQGRRFGRLVDSPPPPTAPSAPRDSQTVPRPRSRSRTAGATSRPPAAASSPPPAAGGHLHQPPHPAAKAAVSLALAPQAPARRRATPRPQHATPQKPPRSRPGSTPWPPAHARPQCPRDHRPRSTPWPQERHAPLADGRLPPRWMSQQGAAADRRLPTQCHSGPRTATAATLSPRVPLYAPTALAHALPRPGGGAVRRRGGRPGPLLRVREHTWKRYRTSTRPASREMPFPCPEQGVLALKAQL